MGLESVAQRWEALERDVLDGVYSHFMADTVGSPMDPGMPLYRELLIGYRELFTELQQKLVMYWCLKAHRNTSIQLGVGAGIRTVDWDAPLRVILGALCTVAVQSEVLAAFAQGFCVDHNPNMLGVDPTPDVYVAMRRFRARRRERR